MRRLCRWLVNGLCLLSLLACLGAGWLWWHSYRGGNGVDLRLRGEWYAVRPRAGRLTVLAFPPAVRVQQDLVRRSIGRIHNGDLRRYAQVAPRPDGLIPGKGPVSWIGILPSEGKLLTAPAVAGISPMAGAGQYRPLLDALGDPGRFAAAHLALSSCAITGGPAPGDRVRADRRNRRVEVSYQGLRFELPPGGAGWGVHVDGCCSVATPWRE